jgi:acyl-CoA reductase-like NAD-dependent aldehyde dehydrogenase
MTIAAPPEQLSDAARSFLQNAHHDLVIGGERPGAADGRTFETLDPATGAPIAVVAHAGAEDVDRAVRAARAAFEDGPWASMAAADRGALIERLAQLVEEHADELAELESLDNGKPLAAAKGDLASSVNHLRYYAGWPTKIEGETIPVSARDVFCYTLREPVGVCAQIVPWNYPLLMAIWKVAPALAAGCAIVLKPAEQTPASIHVLNELVADLLPPGVLNIVNGFGSRPASRSRRTSASARSRSPARPPPAG